MLKKIWDKIVKSTAGRGNCQAGKIGGMEKRVEKTPGKKPGRKGFR